MILISIIFFRGIGYLQGAQDATNFPQVVALTGTGSEHLGGQVGVQNQLPMHFLAQDHLWESVTFWYLSVGVIWNHPTHQLPFSIWHGQCLQSLHQRLTFIKHPLCVCAILIERFSLSTPLSTITGMPLIIFFFSTIPMGYDHFLTGDGKKKSIEHFNQLPCFPASYIPKIRAEIWEDQKRHFNYLYLLTYFPPLGTKWFQSKSGWTHGAKCALCLTCQSE